MELDSAIFYSSDIGQAAKVYTEILALEMNYIRDDKFVSFVFPNHGQLGIKKRSEDREVPGHQTVFIKTNDIQADYEKLKQKGVTFYKDIETKSWGTEFSLLDPDKNKVLFIQHP